MGHKVGGCLPSLQTRRQRDVVAIFLHMRILGFAFSFRINGITGPWKFYSFCSKSVGRRAPNGTLDGTLGDTLCKSMCKCDSELKVIRKMSSDTANIIGNFSQYISHICFPDAM